MSTIFIICYDQTSKKIHFLMSVKKTDKLVKAKWYYMHYLSYVKCYIMWKICRLLGSLSPMQKQGAVSAPKIEIFPHTILSSQCLA